MITQLIILIVLLLLSGFFSSSELAYVVSNKIKIEIRARKNSMAAKSAHYFVENPGMFFSTILVSNNIVNITFASLITIFLTSVYHFSEYQILIISSFVLLIIGELVPKYIARELSDSIVGYSSLPIRMITILLWPIVKLFAYLSELLTKTRNINEEKISHLFDKEDMQSLLNESSLAGVVNEDESDIINKIIELREKRAYEIYTPRTDIVAVDISSSIQEVREVFIESGYSKVPVYEDTIDNIKGILYANEMFKMPESIVSVMKEPVFIPDTKRALELLNELLAQHVSVAVVIDEFGGTAGIVTVEDILEEMLGEIRDEFDVEEEVCNKIDEYTFIISGKLEVDQLNEEHDLKIPEGDYETLAGYITSTTGKIPKRGEIINIDHFKFLVIKTDRKKVDLVKLFLIPEKYDDLNV